MKTILDSVVFFLWPSINPDGQDIVVNWCRANQPDAEHNGRGAVPMELYEKYVGHDNNRDSYMLNVVESRVIQRTWREWEPDVIYVQHQSSPFPTRIWIPPFADPVGLRVPPIMAREVNAIGTRIAERLDANGMPGAVSQLETYDAWYPGYIDYMPMYQNIPSWWTETQGGNCATPRTTTVADLPADYAELRPTSLYSSPWAQGKWGLRDAVNYMVTADIATLDYAREVQERAAVQPLSGGAQHDSTIQDERPVRVLHSSGAARSRGAGGDAAPHGVHGSPRRAARAATSTTAARATRRARGSSPWTRSTRSSCASCSSRRSIPTWARTRRTTRPAGRCHTRWVSTSSRGSRRSPDDIRAALTSAPRQLRRLAHRPDGAVHDERRSGGNRRPRRARSLDRATLVLLDPAQNNSFRLINRALSAGASLRFAPASGGHGARYVVTGLDAAKADAWAKELWFAPNAPSSPPPAAIRRRESRVFKSQPGVMDEGWTEWLFDTYNASTR